MTPKPVIWSSVASRVEAESSSRGASNVTIWRGDADARGGPAQRGKDAGSGRVVACGEGVAGRKGECRLNTSTRCTPDVVAPLIDSLRSKAVTSIVDTQEEAAALDLPPLLIRRPLEAFLDEHGLGSGVLEAEPVGDGHSNVTYLIRRDGGEWVLRRPPRPPLPPCAHDVLREAFLLKRARAHRRARAEGARHLRRRVAARRAVLRDGARRGRRPRRRRCRTACTRTRIGEELIDALVEVHAADWQAAGLEGFGKPTGYLERQLRRFTRALGAQRDARDRGAGRGHALARRAPSRSPARPRSCTATTGSGT